MNTSKFVVVFGLLALVGCGKNKMVVASEAYEKEACACKDVACITTATKNFTDATKENAANMPSGSDLEAYTKSTGAATACITKISMAGIPAMPK